MYMDINRLYRGLAEVSMNFKRLRELLVWLGCAAAVQVTRTQLGACCLDSAFCSIHIVRWKLKIIHVFKCFMFRLSIRSGDAM